MQLKHITRTDAESWTLFPRVLTRISKFVLDRGLDVEPEALADIVLRHFAHGLSTMGLWAFVDTNGNIRTHMLAFIERRGSVLVGFVAQLLSDSAMNANDRAAGLEALTVWARAGGAKHLEMWTDLPERLWSRYYGFALHRKIMRRSI